MQIVVLDGYALNPGDLSWGPLEALGSCRVYDRTAPNEVVARAEAAEIVLTNKTMLSRETIARLPRLRYIGVLATGYNIVDVDAARERGIPVTNVPDYATLSVVQMVFAHLLNLTLHVADHGRGVAAGRWTACPDFAYWDFPLVELAGLTLGVVGFGRIGRATAKAARTFGMDVVACTPPRATARPEHVRFVELEELFRQSDVVSLHCPLTPETRHLVNRERLSWMKPSAFLINTGRGPLVDEAALADALNSGRIAGAGLDVLSTEPPPADNPLLRAKNCCITPHVGWATAAARKRLVDTVAANVQAFRNGTPQNVVNR
ncbi:MAG: D-2-hydroxyacid dehydrogenase [Planctomycetaceae bacterium]|nr:D-2-hydroxyacid dehydrogenase [Planctomycetaceae bacterium]